MKLSFSLSAQLFVCCWLVRGENQVFGHVDVLVYVRKRVNPVAGVDKTHAAAAAAIEAPPHHHRSKPSVHFGHKSV